MTRILILGGTQDAGELANTIVKQGFTGVYSYAGRTMNPPGQPLPTRVGGFGGVAGLVDYIRAQAITHLIDATHPFAAQISRNAVQAAAEARIPLIALDRPKWQPQAGDRWQIVADMDAACAALPDDATTIFLAIGRQTLAPFAAKPQHHYILRFVDPVADPIPLPRKTVTIDRGPFTTQGDVALIKVYGITHIVAKNAGGTGAVAKLEAARAQHLPVIMVDRPAIPPRETVPDVAGVMAWLSRHGATP